MSSSKQVSRRFNVNKRLGKKLELESLEVRRLLSSDGIAPEVDELIFAGGVVSGTKWEDGNRNGVRDEGERGIAGVTIYSDLNGNGRHDRGEPSTVTQEESFFGGRETIGQYNLLLPAGEHIIREVVPDGFVQTFPTSLPPAVEENDFATVEPPMLEWHGEPGEVFHTEVAITIHPTCFRPYELDVVAVRPDGEPIEEPFVDVVSLEGPQTNGCGGATSVFPIDVIVHDPSVETDFELAFLDVSTGDIIGRIPVSQDSSSISGGHRVEVLFGETTEGVDFGNAPLTRTTGSLEGRKWLDEDGNGQQDPGEPGLGGVTIYVDRNNNGTWDRGEPTTRTQFEDPWTDFDEGGLYRFDGLPAGKHVIRELVPEGYAQTFPLLGGTVVSSETGTFAQQQALDYDVTGVKYSAAEEEVTHIQMSVTWNNGCGQLASDVAHAVIGNTILVDMSGRQEGDICTEALKTDTIDIAVEGLGEGRYTVVGTLHEEQGASLGVVGELQLGTGGAHVVEITPGGLVSEVDFGNRRTGDGESVSGTKWHDKNGDGIRQDDEPGLGGVTIYVDANFNGVFDEGEPSAISSSDGESLGNYRISGLLPGRYIVREVVPEGYQQTWPAAVTDVPLDELEDPWIIGPPELIFEGGPGHFITLHPGSQLQSRDFGNQSVTPGGISGTKWFDENGNGVREDTEVGLSGVTIYVDANYNQQLDEGELSAVTGEDGSYTIDGILPGQYNVLEVVPEGYHQTFPSWDWFAGPLPDAPFGIPIDGIDLRLLPNPQHFVNVLPGEITEGIDFGNQKVEPGSISGFKWLDDNGNGVQEEDEPGLAGVMIYVDLNYNGLFDEDEPSAVTQEDDAATADIDETGFYTINGIRPFGSYHVREVVPAGYEQTFPGWNIDFPFPWGPEGPETPEGDPIGDFVPFPFPQDFHWVWVGSGESVEGINFGNRKVLEPGFVSGSKWEDVDGNGQRDEGEPGLAGFVVFADTNRSGTRDFGEPFAVTQRDNPDTAEDESGQYQLKVRPGSYLILEEQQSGYEQTYPNPLRELIYPFNLGHSVDVSSGQEVAEIDFGNTPVPTPSFLSGRTWFDFNANGVYDRGEEPISGVTVYLDANDNGQLDEGEQSTVSGVPSTDPPSDALIALDGFYSFAVEPGDHIIRQVLPEAHIQTYPFGAYELGESTVAFLDDGALRDLKIQNVTTSTTSPNDSGSSHSLLEIQSDWAAAEVHLEPLEVVVEGKQVFVRLMGHVVDFADDQHVTLTTSIDLGSLEFGDYEVQVEVFQEPHVGPDGTDGPPMPGPVAEMQSRFSYYGDDAHRVNVEANGWRDGLDFGQIAVPTNGGNGGNGDADSRMGEDPHVNVLGDSATHVAFHDGHLHLNSYVDADDDVDVFQFAGIGAKIHGEGGRMDGSADVRYELLDSEGQVLAAASGGEPLELEIAEDTTYFLRVQGAQGQYQLDLFVAADDPETTAPVPGDTNGDRQVDFSDFLALSANFGTQVDGAFADGDFTGDGFVSFEDFLILSARFGQA